MSASQIQVRARAAEDRLPRFAQGQDQAVAGGQGAPDTQHVNLGVVLTIWDVLTGRARFPSRGGGVGRTGLDGRPVPVEQDGSAAPALLLLAEQLTEPFQAQRS